MVFNEIAPGLQSSWGLVKKLGEGDAGEVYLVESLLERRTAILKRPHRSAFSSDILRQASQIEIEGKILRALSGLRLVNGAGTGATLTMEAVRTLTPALLDQGQVGAEFSERFFIIQEKATGLNLNTLARSVRFGTGEPGGPPPDLNSEEGFFVSRLAQRGEVPALILLRALSSVIDLFEKIHTLHTVVDGSEKSGLVWNDVKPEHLFWDPIQRRFTVIDWGNGQFLEADGATKDRRYSRLDDYSQFVQEMGKFLDSTSPELHERLEWPGSLLLADAYPEAVKALRERVTELLFEELEGLRDVRQSEEILTLSTAPAMEQLPELEMIQDKIIGYGELPDFNGAERFYVRLASRLAAENRVEEYRQLCEKAGGIPGTNLEKWSLLAQLSEVTAQNSAATRSAFMHALVAGSNDDWAGVLWDFVSIIQDSTPPPWFDDLIHRVRHIHLGDGAEALTPFVTASRLSYTLQAALQKKMDLDPEVQQEQEDLMRCLREDVVRKWNQLEPDPPDSGLDYAEIDCLMAAIQELVPEAQGALARSLDQPKAQVSIILDAWNRKDFETARRGLRNLLVWDPDRRRVLSAERAIQAAPAWLEKIYLGPKQGEPIQDFLTYAELSGRELRNQVGPARWLDLILDAFARLRKGASPADLIAERPELLNEILWLNDYEARRPAPAPREEPVRLEREPNVPLPEPFIAGIQEGALAQEGELFLTDSLDTWVPEARGSSARVFLGFLRTRGGQRRQAAVKVMRPDRVEYALPLFREEIQILTLMREVPGVSGLLECGYIRLEEGQGFPTEDRAASARDLCGSVVRYGINEIRDFMTPMETRTGQGWLPYLVMEKRDKGDNLMTLCDAGFTHGRFLPVDECLRLAIQICEILQAAHSRNIVYRDHKILHYYWQEVYNGIFMIDWNVAKRHPQGLTSAERQFDLVQFGARALHHILTGRPAPGALPLGPTRPEEIEQAAHSYRVQWTYDDQRLPADVKDILEGTLSGKYDSVKLLRDHLYQSFQRLTNGSR